MFGALDVLNVTSREGARSMRTKPTQTLLQEDLLKESSNIDLIPKRKKNSNRRHSPEREFLLSITRNKIETTFSVIVSLMPRCIRAVTQKGFCLKVFLFIFGYMINKIIP